MKNILILFSIVLITFACQESNSIPVKSDQKETVTASKLPAVDTSVFETFSYQEGDTTYLMKKYFMVHLKTGPNRDQGEAEAAEIQKAHLAHLEQLGLDNKICIAGPFEGHDEIQGIAIYSVPSLEIADSLANADPAVKAGRLEVDVIPFWAAVGSQLF